MEKVKFFSILKAYANTNKNQLRVLKKYTTKIIRIIAIIRQSFVIHFNYKNIQIRLENSN